MFWTVEATADLVEHIEARKSSGVTAAFLTHKYDRVTRSACIGKASRMKLKFCSEVHDCGSRITTPRVRRSNRPRVIGAKRERGVSLPPLPMPSLSQADHEIPMEQRKSLLDLDNWTCRWPCNIPGAADFYFCGAPEADLLEHRPYCERHSRTAYSKPYNLSDEERERRRRWANRLTSRMTA